MNIPIHLSQNSISQAKNKLLELKNRIKKGLMLEFLNECADYLLERAKFHLSNSGVGSNVIADIQSHWQTVQDGNSIVIINDSDKAVFVEFGVGIVGQANPHPDASAQGYKYNVPSPSKYGSKHHDDNTWRFYANEISDVDLLEGTYQTFETNSGKVKIFTQGSKGTWYAYNAIQDLKLELNNIWKKIEERYSL